MASTWQVATWARAIADENRLRILLICGEKVANVREISKITRLSDPLVSHHLATLLGAGLVERRRVSRSVEYRAPTTGEAARWIAALMGFVDQSDPQRSADREEREQLLGLSERAHPIGGQIGRLERAMLDFSLDRLAAIAAPSSLRLCVESDRSAIVIELLSRAAQGTAVASSSAAAARLRRAVRGVVGGSEVHVTTARALSGEFDCDAVVVDWLDRGSASELDALLPRVMRWMHARSALLLFVPYDALGGDQAAEHPLLRLRRTLSQHGMQCEQIQPIEAAGQHVLAAAATQRIKSGRRVA